MKGLIIKDLYCIKKEIKLFIGTTLGSVIVAVLFLLSARYGNIADGLAEIEKSEMISGELLISLTDTLALFAIYLPIALGGSLVECFKEDSKAGFLKVVYGMPVSCKKIVGSRYITCLLFLGACFMSSTVCNILITTVSDSLKFTFVLNGTVCLCSIFMIYLSFVILMLYLCGTKRADFIQSIPVIIMIIAGIIYLNIKIENISEGNEIYSILEIIDTWKEFLGKYGLIVFIVAAICMFVSWFVSVKIVENKRGKS